MNKVGELLIRGFNKHYLVKSHIMTWVGFYLGVKVSDYFFYNEQVYII